MQFGRSCSSIAPPTQLVEVAAFRQQYVALPQREFFDFLRQCLNCFDFRQVEMSRLHVCHAEVRNFDWLPSVELPALRNTGYNFGDSLQSYAVV